MLYRERQSSHSCFAKSTLPATTQISIVEFAGDRHTAVSPESARRDLYARRRLTTLILRSIYAIDNPTHGLCRKSHLGDGFGAHIFFNVGFDNRVEHLIRRQ